VNLANKQGGPPQSAGTDAGRASSQQASASPATSDVGKASTQQAPPPAPPSRPRGETINSASAQKPIPPQNFDPHPDWTKTRPGSYGTHLAPHPADRQIFSIQTAKGAEKITGEEYRLRVAEAEGWIIKNHRPTKANPEPSPALYKQAQEKFGLNDRW
jgi:hypothetical protein